MLFLHHPGYRYWRGREKNHCMQEYVSTIINWTRMKLQVDLFCSYKDRYFCVSTFFLLMRSGCLQTCTWDCTMSDLSTHATVMSCICDQFVIQRNCQESRSSLGFHKKSVVCSCWAWLALCAKGLIHVRVPLFQHPKNMILLLDVRFVAY